MIIRLCKSWSLKVFSTLEHWRQWQRLPLGPVWTSGQIQRLVHWRRSLLGHHKILFWIQHALVEASYTFRILYKQKIVYNTTLQCIILTEVSFTWKTYPQFCISKKYYFVKYIQSVKNTRSFWITTVCNTYAPQVKIYFLMQIVKVDPLQEAWSFD